MAAKASPCKQALARWLAGPGGGVSAAEAERVELIGLCPPLEKMDSSLKSLKACRHLALSTNNLDKIGNLTGLENLQILSLGRNCLKKLENLDGVAGTLQELWVSYNQVDRLVSSSSIHRLVLGVSLLHCLPSSSSRI
jgi:dynein light chain 1